MDVWHPVIFGLRRRGRSGAGLAFVREAPGHPIRSQKSYAFTDSLAHQNFLTKRLEDKDPSYHGELDPHRNCTGPCNRMAHQLADDDSIFDSDSDTEPESEEPSSPSLPAAREVGSSPVMAQLPDNDSLFDSDSDREEPSSPVARASMPFPPSPTLTDLLGPKSSRPPVERLSSPFTPAPRSPRTASPTMTELFGPSPRRPPVITYGTRNRGRFRRDSEHTTDEQSTSAKVPTATEAPAAEQKKKRAKQAEAARLRRKAEPSRHSRRLRQGRVGDLSAWGVVEAETLVESGYALHKLTDNHPRTLVDRLDVVMAVVAPGPKGDESWWASVVSRANQDLSRLYHNGSFAHLGAGESLVRFGMNFGFPWGAPFPVDNVEANASEIRHIKASLAFKGISDYQNHLYQQFAPASYAQVASKVEELVRRKIAPFPFCHSVFTTAEISFCDAPSVSRKNPDAAFDTMEAITSFGSYDHTKGGHIIFGDDEAIIELPAGTTVLFPSGTKWYRFAAVGKDEHRFLFKQFRSAGVLRWVEKGGRLDKEFEAEATPEERAAWNEMRQKRGLKSFSKLRDVFVC